MTTQHRIHLTSSHQMAEVADDSIQLIVTSPPYPMIEMWDESFSKLNPTIRRKIEEGDGSGAFSLMHEVLDRVWRECYRVLSAGGFMCVNIGDATRKVRENFRLYTNHSRITGLCESIGFQSLPPVLWRKQTNAPNKFMGSGMLPSGAYVTLEHEYILIFRKGGKRSTMDLTGNTRSWSAYFWEERNGWFSDIWDFKGARQPLLRAETRERSGAYPFELAYRLVNMYSMYGDTVLDPFLGTGTTSAACIAAARHSVGYEIDASLESVILGTIAAASSSANQIVEDRLSSHRAFVEAQEARRGSPLGYVNEVYGFRVMTRQEVRLRLYGLDSIVSIGPLELEASHNVAKPGETRVPTVAVGERSRLVNDQLPLGLGV
jgi:modification methylase